MSIDWKKAFDVINMALTTVAGAGDIPGVNLIPYVSVVASAAKALQMGINAGIKVEPYIAAIYDTFKNGMPTPEAVAALDIKVNELHAAVQETLPPREDDEPE
jgi:hypothetical protein